MALTNFVHLVYSDDLQIIVDSECRRFDSIECCIISRALCWFYNGRCDGMGVPYGRSPFILRIEFQWLSETCSLTAYTLCCIHYPLDINR